ncbi:hypothetical protein CB1_001330015 [Camelus ferus]|nr:hypothetical protein CB1_001330015 [Camelus ferus]
MEFLRPEQRCPAQRPSLWGVSSLGLQHSRPERFSPFPLIDLRTSLLGWESQALCQSICLSAPYEPPPSLLLLDASPREAGACVEVCNQQWAHLLLTCRSACLPPNLVIF